MCLPGSTVRTRDRMFELMVLVARRRHGYPTNLVPFLAVDLGSGVRVLCGDERRTDRHAGSGEA